MAVNVLNVTSGNGKSINKCSTPHRDRRGLFSGSVRVSILAKLKMLTEKDGALTSVLLTILWMLPAEGGYEFINGPFQLKFNKDYFLSTQYRR